MRPRPPKAIVPRELLLETVLTGGNETKTQGKSTERITVDLYAYREERDQDPLRQ